MWPKDTRSGIEHTQTHVGRIGHFASALMHSKVGPFARRSSPSLSRNFGFFVCFFCLSIFVCGNRAKAVVSIAATDRRFVLVVRRTRWAQGVPQIQQQRQLLTRLFSKFFFRLLYFPEDFIERFLIEFMLASVMSQR